MSEIRTNLTISGESSEYRSNLQISVVTLNSNLVDTQSSFRTNLNIVSSLDGKTTTTLNTTLKLENTALDFYLVDMTKINQSMLYFSKFFNMNFEPEVMWEFLAKGTNEQINISHLSNALSVFSTKAELAQISSSINTVGTSINQHILNSNIHLTQEEKTFISEIMNKPPWGSNDNRSGLFEYVNVGNASNVIWAARPIKYENKDVGIISNTFISCKGVDVTAGSGGGGITRADLFAILSGEPIDTNEYINVKYLRLDENLKDYAKKDWVELTFIKEEKDPTVPMHVKNIQQEQINAWDLVASLFSVSKDDTYVLINNNRGLVSNSFLSCRGLDNTASSIGGVDMDLVWFYLQSDSSEQINISHLKDALSKYVTTDWVNAQGYLKSFVETDPTVPIYVKKITETQIFNWDLVASLFKLSADGSYIITNENRGFVSTSFISCKGVDILAPESGSGIDMSLMWFYLGQEGVDQINKSHLIEALEDYATIDWVNNQGYLKSFVEQDPTVPNHVKLITADEITNWNLVSSIFSLSKDSSYVLVENNRGLVSNSFISCKGLDISALQVGGTFDRESLFDILSGEPQNGESINLGYLDLSTYATINFVTSQGYITSNYLTGYATEQWVKQQGYLTQHQDLSAYAKSADVALVYATKTALQTLQNEHNALSTKVTNLDNLLNSDVSGVINTWGEVVDFLDEYSGSEDLATILAGMNNDIANRVLIEDFEKLEDSVSGIAGYFTNGSANNALKLGGQLPSYYATKSALDTTNGNVVSLTQKMGTAESGISTNKTNIATLTTGLSNLTSRVSTAEGTIKEHTDAITLNANNIASNAKSITTNATAITAVSNRVQRFEDVIGIDSNGDVYIKGTRNFYTAGGTIGMAGLGSGGSGGGGTAGIVTVRVNGYDYNSVNGIVTLPDYPSLAGYATEQWVGNNYLGLGGGTITGWLTIKANGYPLIEFKAGDITRGYYGFSGTGIAAIWDTKDWQTLIHSGNIGSQSVNYANNAGNAEKVAGAPVTFGDNKPWNSIPAITANGWMDVGRHFEFHYDNTTGSDYSTILSCTGNYSNIVNLPSTSGTLALLTDNVASATKLQDNTAYTVWGQTFFENGKPKNVSGGMYDVGWVVFDNTRTYGIYKGNVFSQGLAETDLVIYSPKTILGWESMNVLIGTTTDNGYKLQIKGDGYASAGFRVGTAFYTNGEYGIWNGGRYTAALTNNDIVYYANIHSFQGGNVLIGATTDNGSKLQVDGSIHTKGVLLPNYTAIQSYLTDGTLVNLMYMNDANLLRIGNSSHKTVIASAYVGIYTSNPAYTLDVNGTLNATTIYQNGQTLDKYYLPLSGGIIKGWVRIERAGTILACVNTNGTTPYINFRATINGADTDLGDFGVDTNKNLVFYNGGVWRTIVHSGNIASQSVYWADNAGNAEKVAGFPITRGHNKPWNSIPAITEGGYMDVGRHFEFHYDNTTGSDFSTVLGCTGNYGNIVSLPSASGTLALLTDNVASATKLQTARTIWGQSFDGSANVSGIAYFPNGDLIYAKDEGGTYRYVMGLTSGLSLGYGSASAGIDTYILGKNIHFRYYDTDYKYAMSIQNSGNILIGATEDNGSGAKLQVNGRAQSGGYTLSNSEAYYCGLMPNNMITNGGSASDIWLYNNAKILIFGSSIELKANTNIAGNLTVTGDITSEGTMAMARLTSSSDRKLKENIKWLSADRAMGVVRALRPTEWDWKKDGARSFGFIAQDIQPIIPEMVSSVNDTLRLEYNQLHAFEIGAIKHIDSEVEILKRRVNELENELKQYRRNA